VWWLEHGICCADVGDDLGIFVLIPHHFPPLQHILTSWTAYRHNSFFWTSSLFVTRTSEPTMRSILVRSPLAGAAKTPLVPTSILRAPHSTRQQQFYSSSAQAPATAALSPRWLSDVQSRIGKCISFGISQEQTQEAGSILQEIANDWRELVAGSEGFLTGKGHRGLYRQPVAWGEMVVLPFPLLDGAVV
jgi:hypothetical protein